MVFQHKFSLHTIHICPSPTCDFQRSTTDKPEIQIQWCLYGTTTIGIKKNVFSDKWYFQTGWSFQDRGRRGSQELYSLFTLSKPHFVLRWLYLIDWLSMDMPPPTAQPWFLMGQALVSYILVGHWVKLCLLMVGWLLVGRGQLEVMLQQPKGTGILVFSTISHHIHNEHTWTRPPLYKDHFATGVLMFSTISHHFHNVLVYTSTKTTPLQRPLCNRYLGYWSDS